MRVNGPVLDRNNIDWVADLPAQFAARTPDKPAIVAETETVTYAQLDRRSAALCALWQADGLKPGDRIGYLGTNSEVFFYVFFAAARGGFLLASYNWRNAPREMEHALGDSTPAILYHDDALSDLVARSESALPAGARKETVERLRETLRDATGTPDEYPRTFETPLVLMYTSGTTGTPKGALIPHGMISQFSHAYAVSPNWEDWSADDVAISVLPNFHIAGIGFMLMGLSVGATMVQSGNPAPDNLLRLIRQHDADRIYMVPTLIQMLVSTVEDSGEAAPAIKGIYYGAAPISPALLQRTIRLFGCGFTQFYGMTECSTTHVLGPAQHDPTKPEQMLTVGVPLAGVECEIRRPDLSLCDAEEPGEIWVRSEMQMLGYWNRPDATAEAVVDGWYRTGDGGYVTRDGFLRLTDRLKEMIVTGGENVYPVQVENVLREHPAIADLAVVGMPDETWGEAVTAVIQLAPGADAPDVETLRAFGREGLAGYKLPRRVEVVEVLPKTPSGKVQRGKARAIVLDRGTE
ncbi:MAG: class I adenylate-forming enzyme family protein [Sagittula sp.]|uniref:class I adenylate-forming enzyme family protein n=1 Tax=Sagittula sp. TaxID=2038081 RepID=UPI00405A4AF2